MNKIIYKVIHVNKPSAEAVDNLNKTAHLLMEQMKLLQISYSRSPIEKTEKRAV